MMLLNLSTTTGDLQSHNHTSQEHHQNISEPLTDDGTAN